MKKEIISKLHSSFELAVNQNEDIDFWFARDLQILLGYSQWRNFSYCNILSDGVNSWLGNEAFFFLGNGFAILNLIF